MSAMSGMPSSSDHPTHRPTQLAVVLLVLALVVAVLWGWSPRRAGAVASAASGSAAASADDGIVVSATGQVTGAPDVLRLDLGVEVVRPRVDAALRDASGAMTKLRKALSAAGVADKDIATTAVNIEQNYGKNGPSGYRVSQEISVKVRKLDTSGALLDVATKAGGDATRVRGVAFAIEDDDALLTQAREKAFAAAKAKATTYATAADRGLGQVVTVSEVVAHGSAELDLRDAATAASAAPSAPTPLAPGTSQLSVTVTVKWRLR